MASLLRYPVPQPRPGSLSSGSRIITPPVAAAGGALSSGATLALTATIIAAGVVGTSSGASVNETATITATGQVGVSTGATSSVTATITAAGAVGVSSGASLPITVTITTAGTASGGSPASGATLGITDTITGTGVVGVSTGATRVTTATLTSAGQVGVSSGASRSTTATITAAGQVGLSTGATRSETVTITAAGTVALSSGATAAYVATIIATGQVGVSSGATLPLTFTPTAAGTAGTAVVVTPGTAEHRIPADVIIHRVQALATKHRIKPRTIRHREPVEAIAHRIQATAIPHGGRSPIAAYAPEHLGAGGFVTGITISPDGNTRLVRTDTLGAWRWSTTADAWVPSVAASTMPGDGSAALGSGIGVHAIVAGNSVAYMGYLSSIYKSTDGGQHWTVSLAAGPDTAPNSTNRPRNRNMVIDPNNSSRVLYGTWSSGVYFTTNGGSSWTAVPSGSVPFGDVNNYGIPCVCIDGSGNWYAAPYGAGLYRSTNQGGAWSKISNDTDFVVVHGLVAAANGDIMVVADLDGSNSSATARIFRFRSGAWTNITQGGTARQYRSIAEDPTVAGRVLVQANSGYTYLTTDYGDSWTIQTRGFVAADSDVPWLAASNGGSPSSQSFSTTIGGLQWDPVVTGRVWMSQGIGVWYSDYTSSPANTAGTITWRAASRGGEQLVVNDALAPPGGPALSCNWDRPIFVTGEYT